MKLSWRVELVQLAIMAGMFAVAAWAWPQVPDRLPVHWNLQGEVDRYGGKFEGLLLLPLVTLGLYLLLLFVPLIDPGRLNYQNFRKAYNAIRIVLVLFMALIYGLMIYSAFGKQGKHNHRHFAGHGCAVHRARQLHGEDSAQLVCRRANALDAVEQTFVG